MERSRKVFWAQMVVIGAAVPILVWARSGGAEPGRAGVPGEGNCTGCHLGTALNGGSGSVTVAFPGAMQYTPGVTQRLTVTVSDPAQRRFGFQLTARLAGDATRQAGSFASIDSNTQVLCSTNPFIVEVLPPCPATAPLQYVDHTSAAYREGRSSFEFDWTPPATDVGPVTIYVAGNAANGNGNISGDHIYTRSFTLNPAQAGGTAPTIASAVNGASFQPVISPGAWVSIGGTNLAAGTRSWRADEIIDNVLPTALDGVSVTINGKPAAVAFISPTQLNVLSPPDTAAGPVPVVVTTASGTSTAFTVQMQAVAPAFFVWNNRYAVATRPDFSLVGPVGLFPGLTTTPARPGDVIVLWGTGFGATDPAAPAGRAVTGLHNLVTPPAVRIGGLPAEYLGGALTPGSAGLYQIVVRVPEAVPEGDLAVVAEFPGAASPSNLFLTVQR
ncbi:MAG TPA: choice-of-anchor V domain-containing protein [Bryobacteraceae bacterium]|nr:choice-of-anchor V domain-containing protein [Bryobacteraceae bacterium]